MERTETITHKPKVVLTTRIGMVDKAEIRNKLCLGSYKLWNNLVGYAIAAEPDFQKVYEKFKLKNAIPISVVTKLLSINDISETADIEYSNGKTDNFRK